MANIIANLGDSKLSLVPRLKTEYASNMQRRSDTTFDLAIVGAGAAGQMAAISAGQQGRHVVLFEQMPQAGKKILASGGGRANITNLLQPTALASAFGKQGRFTKPALEVLGPEQLRQFLKGLGVATVVDEQSRVYPASQRASDVQTALARHVEQLGVQVRLGCTVNKLWLKESKLKGVETSTGERISAERVILACGGRSWPKLGGCGGGYDLASQAGHTIIAPVPALVPLVTRERWLAKLAGVSIQNARVWIDLPKHRKAGISGDVLFTHRGISGPAVLDLSGTVAQLLQDRSELPLRIELVAGMDAACWNRQIETWRTSTGRRQVATLLQENLPASLSRALCEHAGLNKEVTAAQLPADARKNLANLLSGFELTVTETEGFDVAFVTRGGVMLKEVDPHTLESRCLAGLYLAGELLDLDGPTGGFNLQWAFASGWLAGKCG